MSEQYVPGRSLLRHLAPNGALDLSQKVEREKGSHPGEIHRAGWGFHDSTLSDYGRSFQSIIGSASFPGFLRERERSYGYTTILDLMASEAAVAQAVQLGFTRGLAVSLGFQHEIEWDRELGKGRVQTINDDISSVELWEKVRAWSTNHTEKGIDVVLARPEGGLLPDCIPLKPALYFRLLQNMWKVTAEGGVMIFQTPNAFALVAQRYFEQLQDAGIDVRLPPLVDNPEIAPNPFGVRSPLGFPVKIEKSVGSPRLLPQPRIPAQYPEALKNYLKLVGLE